MRNIILIWTGTHANIPSGFTRETSLDGKFIKGQGVENPNTTGGNSTHTHNATANHSHTMDNHTHTITIGIAGAGTQTSGGGNTYARSDHTHTGTDTSGNASGGGLSSVASTYGAISNDPPYYEVIFIKSDGSTGIPDNAILFFDSGSLPTGYGECDGTNSAPDLRGKYLKGAGVGQNAGGTGGSTTNEHPIVHTTNHTVSGHTHSAVTTPASENTTGTSSVSQSWVPGGHTHSISLNSSTPSYDTTSPIVVCTETVEPSYKKLLAIQNQNGSYKEPEIGMIALWLGSTASIPTGWSLYSDMNDYYLKIATNDTEIGDTAGSNTHTHSNDDHTHTESGTHNHTVSGLTHVQSATGDTGGGNFTTKDTTAHSSSVSGEQATWASATTSADSSNNEPEYRTVAFIEYIGYEDTSAGNVFLENTVLNTSAGNVDFDPAVEPGAGTYKWIIHNRDTGKDIADITDARDKTFSLYLNEESTASFRLNLTNALSSSEFIALGQKELHVYRNNVKVWGGELSFYEGTLSAREEDFTVTARSYESLFKDRYTGAAKQFNAVDAGIIGWTLIDESQQLTNGSFGIASGEIQTSVNRTRLFEYKNIYEALVELSAVDSGIDWEISPNKYFNVYYPSKGSDRSSDDILEYGANVTSVRFSYDFTEPSNRVIVLGKGSGAGIAYADRTDSTSRSTYKLREQIVSFKDTDDQTILDAKGDRVLEESKDPVETLEVTQVRESGILAFSRINIGDTVKIKVKHGLINVYGDYRIRGITVNIADDGSETVNYLVTQQPKVAESLYDVIRKMENQLAIWAATNYALAS